MSEPNGLGERIVASVRDYTERRIEPIRGRLDGILRQLDLLLAHLEQEQQRTLADDFKGAWLAGTSYQRGDLAQKNGALWLVLEDTEQMPGASPHWRRIARE